MHCLWKHAFDVAHTALPACCYVLIHAARVVCRSGGAQLSDLTISGCTRTALDIQLDATGAYHAPALLTNVTLSGNKGGIGSALYLGPSASVELQGVQIIQNTAEQGAVYAAARSSLSIINSTVSKNTGTAVVFAGSTLTVQDTIFTGNAAASNGTTPQPPPGPAGARPPLQGAGGALRLLCFESGPGGYDSIISITNSTFSSNQGRHGGAVYAGAGTSIRLQSVTLTNNTALEGGAMLIDRDSCLADMNSTVFQNNTAIER